MPTALELDPRKHTTFESALKKDEDIINQAAYRKAATELSQALWDHRQAIQALVKHQLRLGNRDTCIVNAQDQWIQGSFNICIPIEVRSARFHEKLIFRCPMPHKLAEAKSPGTVDEKLSSEVGMYAWMQHQCPDVRIPHLYGFGFSDHRHFVHEQQRPFYIRLWRMFQRGLRNILRCPTLSYYTAHPTSQRPPTAYMLLEYIGPNTGQMLSNTWERHRNDPIRRQNLFRGMSRLILSLARIPQRRIGSFQFHNNGTITLTNRPLPCSVIILENDGAPRTIQRNETYTCTEPFVADMLTLHENSFLSNRNAVYDTKDCRGQMAAGALLRMLSHHYVKRERRNGPFYLQLTDFHASNLFVDGHWNITCLLDLEWVCALPAEMLTVPYWLTGHGIDEIVDDNLREFDEVRQEFMKIFEEEEVNMASKPVLASIMHEGWESDGVWFWRCLTSTNGMISLVEDHICPRFSRLSSKAEEILSQYWCQGSAEVVKRKVTDYEGYRKDLEILFSK
ncbi:hypothetical protein F5882DRAFT_174322 [Hyaloscypha sp. PMI_1271]|nr:hypothetical protein F5882DRAFT_174322 [Hyaloscypha sp. PMI_1271]